MDYRITALALKIVMVAFVTAALGFGMWVLGAVAITSFWVGSDLATTINAVLSFGLAGAIAVVWIGPRPSGSARFEILGVLPLAMLPFIGSWLGSVFLEDILVPPGTPRFGPPGIGEIYGALVGALAGAVLLPLAIGVRRVARRQDP